MHNRPFQKCRIYQKEARTNRSSHWLIPIVIFFSLNTQAFASNAQNSSRASQFQLALKRAHLNAGEVGGGIWDLQDQHSLLEHRAEVSMIPASLSKIVTALTILDRFPAETTFETRVLSAAPLKDGVVDGDVVLEGGGDPAFVSEAMAELVSKLKKSGINRITGDLVVNDLRFDNERYDSHRESKRVDRAYDAPIGALSFDWNAVSIFVRPGAKAGQAAVVHLEPMSSYLQLNNHATTGAAGSQSTISSSRTDTKGQTSNSSGGAGDQVSVSGHIAQDAPEKAYYKSISQPDLWTAANFVEFLKREKIEIAGKVKLGAPSTDKQYEVLAINKSPSIGELVLSMMKFSNNFIAEMLTKNLAVQGDKSPRGASMDKGISEIQGWLRSRALKGPAWTFVNPSGLTNENRLTPSQLGQLLKYAYGNLKIYPEFTASLPIAGLDGTLKHRARKSAGQIRAKTGLLKDAGVAALAGFATTPSGHTRAFVWIVNRAHQIQNLQGVWDFLDAMATLAATEQE